MVGRLKAKARENMKGSSISNTLRQVEIMNIGTQAPLGVQNWQ